MTISISNSTVTAVTPRQVAAVPSAASEATSHAQQSAVAALPKVELHVPKANPAVPKFDPEQFQKELEEAVVQLNEQMKDFGRNLGFSVDRKINAFIITVRNTNTGEVVRQIPNEVVVKFAHNLENLKGLLFNKKT